MSQSSELSDLIEYAWRQMYNNVIHFSLSEMEYD